MSELDGMGKLLERIIREEVREALKTPSPHRLAELITDPGSGEYSMSRLCLGVLVSGVMVVIVAAVAGVVSAQMVSALGGMLTSVILGVAGIYGANSALNAWRNGLQGKAKELLEQIKGGADG